MTVTPDMEIKMAENQEELEIEETQQPADNNSANPLDFEEPDVVDWEEELAEEAGESKEPEEDEEEEEDLDLAQVIDRKSVV